MGPHMLGVQPPSFEMSPFPELLGPPPHFCCVNVRQQPLKSVEYTSTPHLLTEQVVP